MKLIVGIDDSLLDKDPECMLSKVPFIEDTSPGLHTAVTGNHRVRQQSDTRISEVAGKKVGNVPANCALFLVKQLKGNVKFQDIYCFAV